MGVGQCKSRFSEVLKRVMSGEEVGISYGKKKELVAKMVPAQKVKTVPIKIGILQGKATVIFSSQFKITEEEFGFSPNKKSRQ